MTSKNFQTLDTTDTEFSADSVEWCPIEPFRDIFACGTYQLQPDEQEGATGDSKPRRRLGRIYLFRVSNEGKLVLLQRLDVAAVLDMKWAHVKLCNKALLGVVNSVGNLQIYELSSETLKLVDEKKVNEEHDDILALSLDWSTGRLSEDASQDVRIVVSDSKGCISVFKLSENELEKETIWNAHGFEAWITAFDYWDPNIIYTGGDDCKFQRFDVRIGTQPIGVSRVHEAGVTSLHSNAANEFLLASGSYDEHLRLWDVRNFRRPVSETNLGGGIWRLKWDPSLHKYLLAACMYGGFRIIDCEQEESPNIVGEYMEHESISYGCDWSFLNSQEVSDRQISNQQGNVALIGTCSFYDHLLKLSIVNLDEGLQ